jgi:MOSC domain-containing protein YiiM
MEQARLVSIQVALPRIIDADVAPDPAGKPWFSAFGKQHVDGPVWLARHNLTGDKQGDLEHHGGLDKAVLAYSAEHYATWHAELGRDDLPHGAFGENFTIAGLDETSVCIGDIYAIGETVVQVSQPRQPCWKIASFWHTKDLTARVDAAGRTGWYLRVLQEGHVATGDSVTLIERLCPDWPVARTTAVTRHGAEPESLPELASCLALSASWQAKLAPRIPQAAAGD